MPSGVFLADAGWAVVAGGVLLVVFVGAGGWLGGRLLIERCVARRIASFSESEQQLRQLAENIQEVFWLIDVATQKLLYVSPNYEKVWGRTCASLHASADPWPDAVHPDDLAQVKNVVNEGKTAGTYDQVYRIVRPDKSIAWIHERAFPVRDAEGAIYRMAGVAMDISGRKLLEEQFLQAQKMEAVGTLAGGIAHDFNNILAAIIGYAEISQLILKDNVRVRGYLGAILKASGRAAGLVRQIMAFSRHQSSERLAVHLQPLVLETLGMLRASIPSTIEFKTSFAADAPVVLADTTQIQQVLMNLGTNAWHAMKDRAGCLEVTLRRHVIDTPDEFSPARLAPGIYARLSVSDTGAGMNEQTRRRIFEPFFTTKPPGEGTGLGLSVVHGIMTAHDGAIVVESEPCKGTVFDLYFPAHAGEAMVVTAEGAPVRGGCGQRILFVDDEPMFVEVGRDALVALGYDVETTTDAGVALDKVRADPERYSLVLTDLTMPGMTGINLAKKIHEIRPGLPIILMTGNGLSLTAEKLAEAGLNRLLLKPVSLYSLGMAVEEALSKNGAGRRS